MSQPSFFIHGHRGCRGLMPESTIEGFLFATELGCDFLEMDVVLTADNRLLVSHEPWISAETCFHHDGSPVKESEQANLNIFRMKLEEVQQFKTGLKAHPKFPDQKIFDAKKPSLAEVADAVKNFCEEKKIPAPTFNIEIKSHEKGDGTFHPEPNEYVEKFLAEFSTLRLNDETLIQSFDLRILSLIHQKAPQFKLVCLAEGAAGFDANLFLEQVGFKPFGFSPNYSVINEAMLKKCSDENLELLAWTVNDESETRRMIDIGVKHIITDFPDRAVALRHSIAMQA